MRRHDLVERSFQTMQDRLVEGLRRAGGCTLEQANRYQWKVFEPDWKQRFGKRPASECDAHRALRKDHNLASSLSYMETRMVNNDYTLLWFGERFQIPAAEVRPRMRKSKLRVERRLNGTLVARWEAKQLLLRACPEPVPAVEPKSARSKKAVPKRGWMDGFWLGDLAKKAAVPPVTSVALRAPSVTGGTG